MMKRNLPLIVAAACLLLTSDHPRPAAAQQPMLQRIEQAIRDRVAQATDAEAPAGAPAAPAEPVPPPPAIRPGSQPERQRGYLGAVVDDKNDRGRGVRVLEVRADGPAAKAGVKVGDLITAIAAVRVRQLSDMADVLALYPPGDTVAVDVLRDEKPQQVKVTLGRSPLAAAPAAEPAPMVPPPNEEPVPPGIAPPAPRLGPPTPPPPPPAAGPALPGPVLPGPATEQAARIDQLQRRVEQLEQRIAELEKALAAATKKK